eukprot:TRINITY_DN10847_c1_g1_i1.p1 TRINITY_DN10847_c1_g1~~TRINITY_DN10847_c1_g1_i1.p1  ORF type:complete len:700 (+),score=154.02 TRINITY_DN10847_c1_g1_i1:427-2526(+)
MAASRASDEDLELQRVLMASLAEASQPSRTNGAISSSPSVEPPLSDDDIALQQALAESRQSSASLANSAATPADLYRGTTAMFTQDDNSRDWTQFNLPHASIPAMDEDDFELQRQQALMESEREDLENMATEMAIKHEEDEFFSSPPVRSSVPAAMARAATLSAPAPSLIAHEDDFLVQGLNHLNLHDNHEDQPARAAASLSATHPSAPLQPHSHNVQELARHSDTHNDTVTLQLKPDQPELSAVELVFPRTATVRDVKRQLADIWDTSPAKIELMGFDLGVDGIDSSHLAGLVRRSTNSLPLLAIVAAADSSDMDMSDPFGNNTSDDDDDDDDEAFAVRGQGYPRDGFSSARRHEFADPSDPGDGLEALLVAKDEMDHPHASVGEFLVPHSPSSGEDFAQAYTARYGPTPYFHQGSFLSAAIEARRNNRSIAVYLHDDRSSFAVSGLDMLQHEHVRTCLSTYYVLWGHDFSRADSRQALFDATREHVKLVDALTGDTPVLVVVSPTGSSFTLTRALSLEAMADPNALAHELEELGLLYLSTVANEPSRSVESLERQSMIEDQDAAYKASLAADRAKAEQEACAAKEAEEAQRQQELQRQAEAQAAQRLAQSLRDEPPASDKSAYRVRFQFPDGTRDHRFWSDATIGEVIAFVGSIGFSSDDYAIVDPVARTELSSYGLASRLAEKGMAKRMKVHVTEK